MIMVNNILRMQRLAQSGAFMVLLISAVGLLGYLAGETSVQWDVSQNGRNSLSQASVEVLRKINGPLTITVYATAQDAQLGNIPAIIGEFLSRYQRIKSDLTVTFIDHAAALCQAPESIASPGQPESVSDWIE